MHGRVTGRLILSIVATVLLYGKSVNAGMPAPLPTTWTADHEPRWISKTDSTPTGFSDARLQAISFFIATLLLSAGGVQLLWHSLRKEITWLPQLTYGRSLALVILWGLLFVIVLTMISGARELMTPGAWRKQGWTYKLNQPPGLPETSQNSQTLRRQALEQLRLVLWQYAATHQGRFPQANDRAIDPELWNIPGWPGVRFIFVPDRAAEDVGQLLVCEPELDSDERQVLLTNGMLGTMRTAEIRQSLSRRSD
jgi:hypothetical protein